MPTPRCSPASPPPSRPGARATSRCRVRSRRRRRPAAPSRPGRRRLVGGPEPSRRCSSRTSPSPVAGTRPSSCTRPTGRPSSARLGLHVGRGRHPRRDGRLLDRERRLAPLAVDGRPGARLRPRVAPPGRGRLPPPRDREEDLPGLHDVADRRTTRPDAPDRVETYVEFERRTGSWRPWYRDLMTGTVGPKAGEAPRVRGLTLERWLRRPNP